MSIELHIERLVLDEAVLGSENPRAVRIAIERELARRLAGVDAIGALRQIGYVASLPSVDLGADGSAHPRLGLRIAASIGQGLGLPVPLPNHAMAAAREHADVGGAHG